MSVEAFHPKPCGLIYLITKKHPTLPKQPEFPRLYGKTYKEVRDGVRRKESAFDVARKGASKCV